MKVREIPSKLIQKIWKKEETAKETIRTEINERKQPFSRKHHIPVIHHNDQHKVERGEVSPVSTLGLLEHRVLFLWPHICELQER